MKNLISLLILVALFAACTTTEKAGLISENPVIEVLPGNTEPLFATLVINNHNLTSNLRSNAAVINGATIANINRVVKNMVTFPGVSGSRINSAELDRARKSYQVMRKHFRESDSLTLNKYRTTYARKLLIDYHLISSVNYNDLVFFTNELIGSQMGNYAVILSALRKLKNNIDPELRQGMVSETDRQIHVSMQKEVQIQQMMIGFVQRAGSKNETGKTGNSENMKESRFARFHGSVFKKELAINRTRLLANYLNELEQI